MTVYQILATKMAVPTTGEVTQPVAMQGANAVVVDLTVFSGGFASVSATTGVILQGSNDLENWTNLDITTMNTAALGVGAFYLPGSATAFSGAKMNVSTQYVRLKLIASSAAVVACGINTSQL